MKLVQRTSNTLTMRYVPWVAWLMTSYLLVKGLAIVGFLLIFGVPHWVTLTCTRDQQQPLQGYCQMTGTDPSGRDQRRWDLDQITAAKLVTTINDQDNEVYYFALITKREQVTLPLSSRQTGDIQPLVTKMQEFLANPAQTHVTLTSDNYWIRTLVIVLLLLFMGVGLTYMIVIEGSIRTLRLNKITGKLLLQQHTLWGTKSAEYPLDKVAKVFVHGLKGYRVGILVSREILWLHPFGATLRRSTCERCAQEIRDFLDLPSNQK